MQVVEIIQQVIADKLARKKAPLHAMQIADIWPLFKEFGTVNQMHAQLDTLTADKIISKHSTINDFAYKPFLEDEQIDTREPNAIRQAQGYEDEERTSRLSILPMGNRQMFCRREAVRRR